MYTGGRGGPKNQAEGSKWFRKAAERENTHGKTAIGGSYEYGWNVPQGHAEAVKWYLRAAEEGDADAQVGLAPES
jgi:uncharacterized protein